jgi:gliding motility-associated-like protein
MLRYFSYIIALFIVTISIAQGPTVPASNIVIAQTSCTETNVSWTNGNGVSRIVIASQSSTISSYPVKNTYYLASDSFGNGSTISGSEFIVYNGIGSSVTVKKLDPNQTYFFSVFEYNGSGLVFDYLNSNYPETSIKTESLSIDYTMSDNYQCETGNVTNFIPSVTQSKPQAVLYSWNFGDFTTSNQQNPSKSYSTYGIFPVKLTVKSPGCKAEVIKFDTIAPEPIVDFGIDPAYPNNNLVQCFFQPDGSLNHFYFKNNSTFRYLSTPYSNTVFKWIYGDGTIDDQIINGDVSYQNPGVYKVKLIISNSFTPRDELCTDSIDLMVEVRQKPIDTALLELDSVKCINGNIFDFKHKTLDATAQHQWDFGDGNTSNLALTSHAYTSTGNYEITLEVTDDNGCYDIYKDSVAVVDQPDNSFDGLQPMYCEGDDDVNLIPKIAGGDWISSLVSTDGIFSPDVVGDYQVSYAVDVDGCKDTFTQSTSVFELPIFELGLDTTICQGGSFTKRINKGNASLLWSTGAVDSSILIQSPGIFWAEKKENGCSFRDSVNVSMISPPNFELGNDSLLCGDGIKNINVTTQNATYSWNDGYTGGEREITSSGYYSVTVSNQCGTFTDDINLTFLPYACEIFIPNAFSPNDDGLNDIFKPFGNVTLQSMQIYNRWGELVYESSDDAFGWDGTYQKELVHEGYYYFIIRYIKPENGSETPYVSSGEVYLMR